MIKHGLKRLLLINTHIKGRAVEIRLDGHANLSGENGAGKTSLLKLIAFFYGSEPAKLCPAIANKKSFVDYFLPSDKSYLVYEYSTETGMHCVVVYRHSSGRKVAYRFLSGPFIPSVFYALSEDGKTKAYSNDELKRHATVHAIELSLQIETVQDYRAVLMNQRSVLERSSDPNGLKRLISLYSLSPRRQLLHLEKISEAALSSEGSLDRIKQIVANIMAEDGIAIPPIKFNKESQTLVEELTALRELEAETPKLEKMVSDAIALTHTREAIAQCHGEFKHWEGVLKDTFEAKKSAREQLTTSHALVNEGWETAQNQYNSTLSKLANEIKAGDDSIAALQEKRIAYEDGGIYEKINQTEQIPALESQQAEAERRLNDLEEKGRDAQTQYLRDKEKLTTWHSKQSKELHAREVAIGADESALAERVNNQKTAIQKRFTTLREELAQRFRQDGQELIGKLSSAKAQAQQSFVTEEEQLSLAVAEDVLSTRDSDHQKAIGDLSSAKADVDRQQKAFDDAIEARRKANNSLNTETETLNRIASWLSPEAGTLRDALVKQGQPWMQTLAKVIEPSLLDRKDLKPGWVGDALSLYGWTLSLDVIDVPAYARSLEDITRQHDAQAHIVTLAKERLATTDETREKAEKALRSAREAWQDANRMVTAAQALLDGAKTSLKNVKLQIREAQERRREIARGEVKRLEDEKASLQKREIETRQELVTAENEALRDSLGTFAGEHEALRHARANLQENQKVLALELKEQNRQLDVDKQERLSKHGISGDTLEKAERSVIELKSRLEQYRGYRPEVFAFEIFCESEWPRVASLQEQVRQQREERRVQVEERDRKESAFQEVCAAYRSTLNDMNREIRVLNGQQATVTSALLKLRGDGLLPVGNTPARALDLLEIDLAKALEGRSTQERNLLAGIRIAENILTRPALIEAWTQSCREIDKALSDIDQALQKATAIDGLLRTIILQVRETLLYRVRNVGLGLNNLYESMEIIQKAVARDSRRISNSIKELATAEALQDIELKLLSRIETLDYWEQLKRFHGLWEEWRKMDDTLPSRDFEAALGNTLKELLLTRKDTTIESLFDIELAGTENGHPFKISTDKSMNAVSSTGLTLMFIFTIYAGITRLYCQKSDLAIHWPVDELARLDPKNAGRLVELMNSCGVIMVGGFPSTDESLTRIFVNKHIVDHAKGIVHFTLSDNPIERALQERALAREVAI